LERQIKVMKKKAIDHEILERIAIIDKRFIEDLDPTKIPSDPEEFLSWWWNNHAKACEACPLSETRNHVVKPDGNTKAKIMIIGEGPGFLEDLTQTPMVGPLELKSSHCSTCKNAMTCFDHRIIKSPIAIGKSAKAVKCLPNYTGKLQLPYTFYIRSAGAILDGILIKKWKFTYARHNWLQLYNRQHPDKPLVHDSPWFITNVVLCRTTDVAGLKDSPPESVPRQKCKKHLAFQWAAVNPELVICFGRVALSVLLGSEEAAKSVAPNTIVETKFGPVLFQNHPAWFMREKSRTVKAYGFAKVASTLERGLQYVGLPTT
jgi:uracil-DNA glycosylase